jgi:Uncharacterized conserved domain (SAYSvFN)
MSPTGLQRSRALWDNCRTTNYIYDENGTSPTHGWSQTKMSRHLRAILYEIQPIRYSVLVSYFSDTYRYLSHVCPNIVTWGRGWVPQTCNHVINTFRALSWDQWKWAIAIALYYVFLRWIHETLDAGPVVLILTALTAIFTVGLSDQTNMDGLSAYSVFNKGFQKIMGSIDAEDLLQQHLGGGGIMHMIHRRQVDDNVDLDEPRHRRPRQQNNQRGDVNNIDNGDNQDPPAENNINHNRARRTGKKARRDRAAIEQRREIRAQRDAALAMGFGHNDEDLVARIVIDDNDDALDDGN